jgi:hypothetical protein
MNLVAKELSDSMKIKRVYNDPPPKRDLRKYLRKYLS